jgi:hypothetical protein
MNKIERAIYDVQLHIKNKEREILVSQAELKTLKEQLGTLEVIRDDKHIPHSTLDKTLNS